MADERYDGADTPDGADPDGVHQEELTALATTHASADREIS